MNLVFLLSSARLSENHSPPSCLEGRKWKSLSEPYSSLGFELHREFYVIHQLSPSFSNLIVLAIETCFKLTYVYISLSVFLSSWDTVFFPLIFHLINLTNTWWWTLWQGPLLGWRQREQIRSLPFKEPVLWSGDTFKQVYTVPPLYLLFIIKLPWRKSTYSWLIPCGPPSSLEITIKTSAGTSISECPIPTLIIHLS